MTQEKHERRPRGSSPRGDFETAKAYTTATEDARVAADKRKTEALREARLRRQGEQNDSPTRLR